MRPIRELWGIDDPAAEQAILKRVEKRATGMGYLFVFICGAAIPVAILNVILHRVWHVFIPGWAVAILGAFVGSYLGNRYARRAREAALRDVLIGEGRCVQCGYQLTPDDSSCPECGAGREG